MTNDIFLCKELRLIELKKVLANKSLNVILFKTNWSGNAKLQESILQTLAMSYSRKAHFYTIDIEQAGSIVRQFNIQQVPTMLFFFDRTLEGLLVGLCPEREVKRQIERILKII